jgi:transcriptional regulator with XRE-family HTH domain
MWTGEMIRNLRCRLGWSAADLARRLSVSVEAVRHWENGQDQPSKETRQQLKNLQIYAEHLALSLSHTPVADHLLQEMNLEQINHDNCQDLIG